MIKTVIIENEQLHTRHLQALLENDCNDIQLLAICDTAQKGITAIKETKPDLVFLDVQLEPDSGFDVLEGTRGLSFETIFTTSYHQYAVKAFRFCALDYILKPFGIDELKIALDRYKSLKANGSKKNINALLHNYRQMDKSRQIAGIPVLGGIDFITVADIVCCKASGNYTTFHLINNKNSKATKTLKWVEDLLSEHLFYRVHDNCLINLNHIKKYRKGGEGGFVVLTGDIEIDVARRKKDEFLKVLAELKIILGK